jgi:putative transposase
MKKSRFTESQIVAILKEAHAGLPVGDVIRKHGISSASYYKWKAKYGGLDASELKRIKELEAQLSEFKRIRRLMRLITNRFFRQLESMKQWTIWLASGLFCDPLSSTVSQSDKAAAMANRISQKSCSMQLLGLRGSSISVR